MPWYSDVSADVICPYCGKSAFDRLRQRFVFDWGKIESGYRVGQDIDWIRDSRGNFWPPFTWYRKKYLFLFTVETFNWGDPQFRNVMAIDIETAMGPDSDRLCVNCGKKNDGVAVIVEENRITAVRILLDGELAKIMGGATEPCSVVVVRADGSLWPRFDWENGPILEPPS